MKTWILILLACCAGLGQQTAAAPAFEVASVKPSEPPTMGRMMIRMEVDGEMLRYVNIALKDIIRTAYRVKEFQVEGPDWLASSRFDITAKLPEGATEEHVPEMLQALLAERFQMKARRETKDHNVYALIAGKNGAKLQPAAIQTSEEAPRPGPGGGRGRGGRMQIMMSPGGLHMKLGSTTVGGFGDTLSRFAEKPIVDMTGIEGQYDFDVTFTPETMRNMPGAGMRPPGPPPGGGPGAGAAPTPDPAESAGSIYDAVEKYGLKLEPRKAPMEVVVIDSISKEPTEN